MIQSIPRQELFAETPVYGISIKYQRDWVKQEGVMGTVVAFLSPKEGTSDIFQENLNIMVQDLSKSPMTLSEYTVECTPMIGQIGLGQSGGVTPSSGQC